MSVKLIKKHFFDKCDDPLIQLINEVKRDDKKADDFLQVEERSTTDCNGPMEL